MSGILASPRKSPTGRLSAGVGNGGAEVARQVTVSIYRPYLPGGSLWFSPPSWRPCVIIAALLCQIWVIELGSPVNPMPVLRAVTVDRIG